MAFSCSHQGRGRSPVDAFRPPVALAGAAASVVAVGNAYRIVLRVRAAEAIASTNNRTRFQEEDAETFEAAWKKVSHGVCERTPLTQAEIAEGWREDPVRGLRRNVGTGERDDTCFIHLAPKRPS
jgi:hypothetical protein